MNKIAIHNLPCSEHNDSPSICNTQVVTPNSVESRLPEVNHEQLPTNGYNLDSLREFAPISRHDDIDRIGIATNLLSESAAKYSKSALHAQFIKQLQTIKKSN